jgi:aspartate-semialdehyde dehydrogenase
MSTTYINVDGYDSKLIVNHQRDIDQADDKEQEILSVQAELIGNAIADQDAFITLQDELLYDNDLVDRLNTAIYQAFSGKGNAKLFAIMEQAARIEAEKVVKNRATVQKVTGLFAQMGLDEENSLFPQLTRAARKHYEQNG